MTQTNYVQINDEIQSILTDSNMNLSQKVRKLDSLQVPRGQIAKLVNRKYQHVRNILITPLKKQS